jgi:hypothetical protein
VEGHDDGAGRRGPVPRPASRRRLGAHQVEAAGRVQRQRAGRADREGLRALVGRRLSGSAAASAALGRGGPDRAGAGGVVPGRRAPGSWRRPQRSGGEDGDEARVPWRPLTSPALLPGDAAGVRTVRGGGRDPGPAMSKRTSKICRRCRSAARRAE